MATFKGTKRARPDGWADCADATWAALAARSTDATPPSFDPATLEELPPPAQRHLTRALPSGVTLSPLVELEMQGEIRLGDRWLGFTARQILRLGVGFVWAPIVGGRLVRFVGADMLGPHGVRTEFRFHGRIPVVRGSGADIRRSAQGRLAAETVAWLPQALTPQAGARWSGVDDERSIVRISAAGDDVDVEVAVDDDGQIRWLGLQRWKDSAKPPAYASFGGSIDSIHIAPNGVRIAGSGTVGWDWQTAQRSDGEFFRYRITAADFPTTTSNSAVVP